MAITIKKGSQGSIDMTPMIDVVFQLMIFFLVAARLEDVDSALELKLPQAEASQPLMVQPYELLINIERNGQIIVQGNALSVAELDRFLSEFAGEYPSTRRIVIRADEQSWHQHFTTVLDLCKKHRLSSVRVATEHAAGNSN